MAAVLERPRPFSYSPEEVLFLRWTWNRLLGGSLLLVRRNGLVEFDNFCRKKKLLIFNISSHDFSFRHRDGQFFYLFFFQLKWQMSVGDVIGRCCRLEAIYLVVHGSRLKLAGGLARVWVALPCAAASFHSECTKYGPSLPSFYVICTEFQRRLTSLELLLLFLLFALAPAANTLHWNSTVGFFRLRDKPLK